MISLRGLGRASGVFCGLLSLGVASPALAADESGAKGGDSTPPAEAVPESEKCWPELSSVGRRVVPGMIVRNVHLESGVSPTLDFEVGKSLAELVELPVFKRAYRVEFWMSIDLNFSKPSEVMIPSAAVLDERYCLIRDYPELTFAFEHSWVTGERHEKARVPVDSSEARYVLVYTDPRFVDEPVRLKWTNSFGSETTLRRAEQGYVMVRLNK